MSFDRYRFTSTGGQRNDCAGRSLGLIQRRRLAKVDSKIVVEVVGKVTHQILRWRHYTVAGLSSKVFLSG